MEMFPSIEWGWTSQEWRIKRPDVGELGKDFFEHEPGFYYFKNAEFAAEADRMSFDPASPIVAGVGQNAGATPMVALIARDMIPLAILNGAGRTREAVAVAAGTLVLLVLGLAIGIPRATPGRSMLVVCASATSGAMLLGALASGVLLVRRFGGFVRPLSALRVLVAVAAAFAAGWRLRPQGKVMTLAAMAACGLAFIITLVATGELRPADLRRKA